jgi:hypothetical protein
MSLLSQLWNQSKRRFFISVENQQFFVENQQFLENHRLLFDAASSMAVSEKRLTCLRLRKKRCNRV